MQTHAVKNTDSQSTDRSEKKQEDTIALQFEDNRPEATLQKKMQAGAGDSPQARKIAQFQATADGHASQQSFPVQKKENNTGMPNNLKSGIENLSGYSMDDVKVHYNSDKPAQLQAHAYAQGTNIHIASGQERHLPHEAWHVVQQKQGRVKPTMQMKGNVNVNGDAGLEKEADVMGNKAFQKKGYEQRGRQGPELIREEQQGEESMGTVQRVELGDAQAYTDGWRQIADDTGNWMAFVSNGRVAILVPTVDFAATIENPVNNMPPQYRDVGCSVCVAASYMGTTAIALSQNVPETAKGPLVQIYNQGGTPDRIITLYTALNIYGTDERFDNYNAMRTALTEDSEGPAWTGALAWEGHIVRISGQGNTYQITDPQTGATEVAVPTGVPLILITFA